MKSDDEECKSFLKETRELNLKIALGAAKRVLLACHRQVDKRHNKARLMAQQLTFSGGRDDNVVLRAVAGAHLD